MSVTTMDAAATRASRRTSLHRQRLWALWGSYIALAVFVVIFLVPPFYTLMTSFKSSHEIGAERWRYALRPAASHIHGLDR